LQFLFKEFNIFLEKSLKDNMLKEKVEEVLEKIRPGLKAEGGNIELIDIKDTVVYVKLSGACATCNMSTLTIRNLVESAIKRELPEITSVKAV
jgi:Fe-S cluster biogenesis protein NfuA